MRITRTPLLKFGGSLVSFFDYPNESSAKPGNVDLLLADASEEEWATLLEHTRYRRFDPGEAIVTAGAQDQSLYDRRSQLMAGPPIIEIREPGRQVRRVVVDRASTAGMPPASPGAGLAVPVSPSIGRSGDLVDEDQPADAQPPAWRQLSPLGAYLCPLVGSRCADVGPVGRGGITHQHRSVLDGDIGVNARDLVVWVLQHHR
jgi:hypothetical protein